MTNGGGANLRRSNPAGVGAVAGRSRMNAINLVAGCKAGQGGGSGVFLERSAMSLTLDPHDNDFILRRVDFEPERLLRLSCQTTMFYAFCYQLSFCGIVFCPNALQ